MNKKSKKKNLFFIGYFDCFRGLKSKATVKLKADTLLSCGCFYPKIKFYIAKMAETFFGNAGRIYV
ncbi:hypothetical protein I592_02974 [Enterococcus gilvus ATCC BAA-350]|uniref:Uncharacterized protein n=1 Tax=Enterococcus gilvus ATCC BAA-350 TaxID=1158614 RepID=R2VGT3_9ENTE|nr:hypothetical protein UKC_00996 [Enterococcus gilvus ATCC BAA-350]EOW83615.1 hypothetical protein I592_02974 [Enterococcus gilvus ATCC BAA-350]